MCSKNRQTFTGSEAQRFTENLSAAIPVQAGVNGLYGLGNIHRAGGGHGHPM